MPQKVKLRFVFIAQSLKCLIPSGSFARNPYGTEKKNKKPIDVTPLIFF